MQVLWQDWKFSDGSSSPSISRDEAALQVTKRKEAEKNGWITAEPVAEHSEIVIQDDCLFARMVRVSGTVFFHDAEEASKLHNFSSS